MVKVEVKTAAFMTVSKIVIVLIIADFLVDWLIDWLVNWLMDALMLVRPELGKEVVARVLSTCNLFKEVCYVVARFMSPAMDMLVRLVIVIVVVNYVLRTPSCPRVSIRRRALLETFPEGVVSVRSKLGCCLCGNKASKDCGLEHIFN